MSYKAVSKILIIMIICILMIPSICFASKSSDEEIDTGLLFATKEYLRIQIENAKCVKEYDENATIDDFDTIRYGKNSNARWYDEEEDEDYDFEWLVLEKQDDRALLLSKYILYRDHYSEHGNSNVWDKSLFRRDLNYDMNKYGFNKVDASLIATCSVITHTNEGDKQTEEKVFVLSIDECKKYFNIDDIKKESKKLAATMYDKEAWEHNLHHMMNGSWSDYCEDYWLRDAGENSNEIAYVRYDGSIDDVGKIVNFFIGVRPAMWIKYK